MAATKRRKSAAVKTTGRGIKRTAGTRATRARRKKK